MGQSSIHIEAGHSGYLAHNDRSQKTVNRIFPENENEVFNKREQAFAIYKSELAKRAEAYQVRTKQKLQKKAITHLSAIVNLEAHHTLDDLTNIGLHLEKKFDTKVFQIAIHRDEGHVEDDGTKVVNYHAHIEFMGLDSEGASVRKKLTKGALSTLQSYTAKSLNMERGTNYAKERKPRPKRLGTYEYKAAAKAKEDAVRAVKDEALAKQWELKVEIAKLKEKLQSEKATRPDYAKLEALNKDLKAKIKAKNLTATQLEAQVLKYQDETQNLKDENEKFREARASEHQRTLESINQATAIHKRATRGLSRTTEEDIERATEARQAERLDTEVVEKVGRFSGKLTRFFTAIKELVYQIVIKSNNEELSNEKNHSESLENELEAIKTALDDANLVITTKEPNNVDLEHLSETEQDVEVQDFHDDLLDEPTPPNL